MVSERPCDNVLGVAIKPEIAVAFEGGGKVASAVDHSLVLNLVDRVICDRRERPSYIGILRRSGRFEGGSKYQTVGIMTAIFLVKAYGVRTVIECHLSTNKIFGYRTRRLVETLSRTMLRVKITRPTVRKALSDCRGIRQLCSRHFPFSCNDSYRALLFCESPIRFREEFRAPSGVRKSPGKEPAGRPLLGTRERCTERREWGREAVADREVTQWRQRAGITNVHNQVKSPYRSEAVAGPHPLHRDLMWQRLLSDGRHTIVSGLINTVLRNYR